MRMSKQVDTRQPPSDVRAPTVAGVGGPVKNLILKVSKQGYLSFSWSFVRCFAWAAQLTQEARWAPPGGRFRRWSVPWSYLGKQRVTCR